MSAILKFHLEMSLTVGEIGFDPNGIYAEVFYPLLNGEFL